MSSFFFCGATAVVLYCFFKLAAPGWITNPLGLIGTIIIPFLLPRLTPSYRKTALAEFLSSIIIVVAYPGYLYGTPPSFSRTVVVLLIFSFTFVVSLLFLLSSRIQKWFYKDIPWNKILYASVFLYAGLLATLSCYLYKHYFIGLGDTGDLLQGIWSGSQGKFFLVSSMEYPTHFAYHNYAILFALAPFYKILPTPLSLYCLRSLLLALCGIVLYRFSRKDIPEAFSFLLAFCLLTAPLFIGMHVEEVIMEPFTMVFIILAFYYFEKENFLKFILFFLLALTPKEDMSLNLAFFGIYSLIRKRSKRWICAPLVLSLAWFLLSELVIIPHFSQGRDLWVVRKHYGIFGHNIPEIIIGMFSNPLFLFKVIFTVKKLQFFWIVLSSMGMIFPFLTSAGLFTLPSLFKVGLAGVILEGGRIHSEIRPWYATPTIVFGYVALFYFLKKLMKRHQEKWVNTSIFLFLFLQLMINVVSYPYWTHLCTKEQEGDFPRAYAGILDQLPQKIPKDASIAGPRYLLSAFHQYDHFYDYRFAGVGADFIILDMRKANRLPQEKILALKEEMIRSREYDLFFQEKEISLYKIKDLYKQPYKRISFDLIASGQVDATQ